MLMAEELPRFKYHPEPLVTGAVETSAVTCACCRRARGYIYVGPVYAEKDLDGTICPWCIADGSAAEKLGASFVDDAPLEDADLDDAIIEELHSRTPGYTSWQQDEWLTHCADACEFHGDAAPADVSGASAATRQAWLEKYGRTEADWTAIAGAYGSGGDSAFYKFVCRHCKVVLLGYDCA